MSNGQFSLWQKRLRERLFEQPYPLWIDDEGVLPAASLWYMMRGHLEVLRKCNVRAGDRVLLALPPNREFLAWMFAALWQGCTLALVPPSANVKTLSQYFDAALSVSAEGVQTNLRVYFPQTPDVSFLLASSGTTSAPRFIALSAKNIFSVIDTHLPHLHLVDAQIGEQAHYHYAAARVLSLLPLHHAFGLVIDFFTAFFAGAEIVRDTSHGRDTAHILTLAKEHHITHCSMVPLLAWRLAASKEGRALLQTLQGGVVGGAPVNTALAQVLAKTRLRVGYGQTEAAPGITLGQPSVWCEGYIGTPLGCETRINAAGVLEFRGENAYYGVWTEQGLKRRTEEGFVQEEWIETNDYVRPSSDLMFPGYIFVGRADDSFKLANGRFIPAPHWEALLKSRIAPVMSSIDLMICTLDGETCTVALQLLPEQKPLPNEDVQRIITDILEVSPEIFSKVEYVREEEWCYTPKGSIDRRAMEQLLRQKGA